MKKTTSILLALCMALTLTSCGKDKPPTENPPPEQTQGITPNVPPVENGQQGTNNTETPEQPFEGKIVIVTPDVGGYAESYFSGVQLVDKYGEEKVIHRTLPLGFIQNPKELFDFFAEIADDSDNKALIISPGYKLVNEAIDKLLKKRNDMFIVNCVPYEDASAAKRANLLIECDWNGMGEALVDQADDMGAKVFCHYLSPQYYEISSVDIQRRNFMEKTCEELGIEFVKIDVPYFQGNDWNALYQYIRDDISKQIAKYGKDTAFYSPKCFLQTSIIESVVEWQAIYPSPCCPSPFSGLAVVFPIDYSYFRNSFYVDNTLASMESMESINYVNREIKRIVAENNMIGRIASWLVPTEFLSTYAGTEYAIKWLNGEVSKEGIDTDVLVQIMNEYTGVECSVRPFEEDGVVYPNFLMFLEGYITY